MVDQVSSNGDPEMEPEPPPEPEPDPEPREGRLVWPSRRRLGGGGGGGGGGGPREPSGEQPLQGYWLSLHGSSRQPSLLLLAPSIITVQALGGSLGSPLLVEPEDRPLAEAFINYVALTTFAFDDARIPPDDDLRSYGAALARDIGVIPFRTFLEVSYPHLSYWQIEVEFGPVELGSLRTLKKVGIVVGIIASLSGTAATAPTAWKNTKEIYWPAVQQGLNATSDYMEDYFEKVGKIVTMDVKPTGPIAPEHRGDPPLGPPPSDPRHRRTKK